MKIFLAALLIAAIVVASTITIVWSRKRIRKRYLSKSRSEITEARVFAKKHFILFLCFAFVAPIPLSFVSALFTEGRLSTVFIAVIIFVIVGSVVLAVYWWTVEGVTRSILENQTQGLGNISDNKQRH